MYEVSGPKMRVYSVVGLVFWDIDWTCDVN